MINRFFSSRTLYCVFLGASLFSTAWAEGMASDLFAVEEADLVAERQRQDYLLGRAELSTTENYTKSTDSYLEGYIQGLIDVHYYELNVFVVVKAGTVYLYNLPKNEQISNSIITFVKHLPEVNEVKKGEEPVDKKIAEKETKEVRYQIKGIWFPQSSVLFQPLIADPREPVYSVGYRWEDKVMGTPAIAVSLGDTFPIYRWRNVFTWHGDLQIDIQAGVWSTFKMGRNSNPNHEISELINTDYLVGIPLSYAVNRWSYRLRFYHVSSHLGDEFLVNHPGYPRKNPSMEALDFFTSYQFGEGVRLYFGPGWICHSDQTYPMKNFYIEYGTEIRQFGFRSFSHRIYGTPFLAMNWRNWQVNHWQFDGTYQLGYEWSKLQGIGRKVRLYGEYHHGYSEGQFFKEKIQYWSVLFSYGF